MKAILEFDTNDPEQEVELARVMKSKDMALALWRVKQDIYRKLDSQNDDHSESYYKGLEDAQEALLEAMEEYGVNLDDILQ